jgi:enolase
MDAPTIVSRLRLRGRETLSSYASFTLEGELTAHVQRTGESWTHCERNGVPKGTSDGSHEAVYVPVADAIRSLEAHIAPLLPAQVVIEHPSDILTTLARFDLALVRGAGENKRVWGGNACLAASTTLFQLLLRASGAEPWELLDAPAGSAFTFPNIAFNMVCGGEHVPGTRQDVQEMFFFVMGAGSLREVFVRATEFFRRLEQHLVRDGLPTGTAKERGFVFPVADNFDGLRRMQACARELGLAPSEYALGTDNAFSELQHDTALIERGVYDLRFSQGGQLTREQLVALDGQLVESADNFVSMEDPGSEHDVEAHRLMNARYGERVQLVLDDLVVTQLRFLIPSLCAPDRAQRAGNSVLIKMNQTGTFTETRLAIEVVLGLADPALVRTFLEARGDLPWLLEQCAKVGVHGLEQALANIAAGGFSVFISHRSTEGSSEFLPLLPLLYGRRTSRLWLKAGAPNGERNLQHYNPLLRADERLRALNVPTRVAGYQGLPRGVHIPALAVAARA